MGIKYKLPLSALLVYFLFYLLWGIHAGMGILQQYVDINGIWCIVIGLSVLSCLFEWLKWKILRAPKINIYAITKCFLVLNCRIFYANLMKNALLSLFCYGVLALFFSALDCRYLTLFFLLFFLNVNNLYRIVVGKNVSENLSMENHKGWFSQICFVKESKQGDVYYVTYSVLRKLQVDRDIE